jgi:hypothetical protein
MFLSKNNNNKLSLNVSFLEKFDGFSKMKVWNSLWYHPIVLSLNIKKLVIVLNDKNVGCNCKLV